MVRGNNMDYRKRYEDWLSNPYFDEKSKQELEAIRGNDKEIKERFFKELEFGTGGLRGILGAGINRVNIYTIRRATQGLANYILRKDGADKGVAIAYDSRRMSPEFAMESALCLAANGIKAYLFESLRPTPELSFALRELGCISGIVITASHNPPEYNGYKVYWEDGGQITWPMDEEIINEVNEIKDFSKVRTMDRSEALDQGLLVMIGEEIDNRYIEELKKLVINPISQEGKKLKIVYTPLHGAGNGPARRILEEIGFDNVYVVPEQELPDTEFYTVGYPNPEDPKVFALGKEMAEELGADIIMATDPDADRLGVQVRDLQGEFVNLNGNMIGAILAEYILSQLDKMDIMPDNPVLIKTIVTGNLSNEIAKYYNAKLIEVLTGFKYIGEQIKMFEETGSNNFVFGFEESYGYLVGTHSRDKDAIASLMTLCEAAAYYKSQGITLYQQLGRIYEKYGYFKEETNAVTLKGIEGMKQIQLIMSSFRENPPKTIGRYQVINVRDYKAETITNLKFNKETSTGLPKSDVIYFDLEDNAWCAIRPSGTEPKIKFYFGVRGHSMEDARERVNELREDEIFKF